MDDYKAHVSTLPYAYGGSAGQGMIKDKPDNFKVNECLSFEPSGSGEHVFLYIQKTDLNTEDVVKQLAKYADVPRRSVSYAGMKDRYAVTRQWFSVQLPGKTGPDWDLMEQSNIQVLQATRHLRKLKRGSIKLNDFEIVLNDLVIDKKLLEQNLDNIRTSGVPNYFMEQRFGYACQNLSRVYALFASGEKFKNKKTRGIFLSSARSYLFNQVLASRVVDQTWNKGLSGDIFILDGSRQFFQEDVLPADTQVRLDEHDIHCSGPLFGTTDQPVEQDAGQIEQKVFDDNNVFCKGLLDHKLESSRRALRVVPQNLIHEWLSPNSMKLSFSLPSGSYATAVIRELIKTASNKGL